MVRSRKKHWESYYLKSLVDFIAEQSPDGYSINDLASRMGVSSKRVSAIFISDNISISKAESLVGTYGYKLRFKYKTTNSSVVEKKRDIQFPNAGNLAGLLHFFRERNLSFHYVSSQVGCSPKVLVHAFTTGNIMIKQLYEITQCMNICLEWSFEKTKKSIEKAS